MLTPSTAHLWVPCSLAGSVNCSEMPAGDWLKDMPALPVDDEDEEARREGRAAHWVGQQVLRGDAADCFEMDGETAPNGWLVTPDMCRDVQGYVNVVRSVGGEIAAETPTQLTVMDPVDGSPRTVMRGRSDVVVSNDHTAVFSIFELKYGRRIVEAERNWPMLCHAVSNWDAGRHAGVTMTVVQPRVYHPDGPVRTWTLTGPQFEEYARFLLDRIRAAYDPEPIGTPGEQCRDCAGAAKCYALARSTYRVRQIEEDRRMVHLTAEQASRELADLEFAEALVKARRKALAGEIEGRMKSGEWFPGRHMREKRADRAWSVPPTVRHMLLGIDPHKAVERSPAEMEREGALPHVVEKMTHRPFIGRELAPLTSKDFDRAFKDHPVTPQE